MHGYRRPEIVVPTFRDAAGAVIPYGQRWADRGWDGPDETYSVTAHPERFAPYVRVADVIVDHLAATYDVRRDDARVDGTGEVRLTPADPSAAPLSFVFDPTPPVHVVAGVATDIAWFCPCDHCDEDVLVAIETLEEQLSAVVDGRLREWLNDPQQGYTGDELFLAFALTDGSGSTSIREDDRDALRARFSAVPPRWAPWTLRRR